jgi:4-alpha-glucanotransferase
MFPRSSGILLHLSSLPGPYGIGSMGKEARHFVDFLHKAGQHYWQLLPLVPPGEGASPYMSPSSAAGNPLFIDLEELEAMGLLTWQDLDTCRYYAPDRVDYNWVTEHHNALLKKAYENASPDLLAKAQAFAQEQGDWLPDYALFRAAHDYFGCSLADWSDEALKHREPEAMQKYQTMLEKEIGGYVFNQYLFFQQWNRLKAYANQNEVSVIGDIPFYVSPDSVDVWVHPELFRVDPDTCKADFVAGVPADMFSATGQLWGNPLYKWEAHEADGYKWWCDRIKHTNAFYDVIRIDHFRGFHSYWEIPAAAESALDGKWCPGPGMKLLNAIQKNVPEAEFIAEDLGDIDEKAYNFIVGTGLPGMRVLCDAFNDAWGNSSFLPRNCVPEAVMYTGTHDTPTFVQWYNDLANDNQRDFCNRYMRLKYGDSVHWTAISEAWSSVCNLAMAPLQDVLGLGGDARMNAPGTMGDHNWTWRVRMEALNDKVAYDLRGINAVYGRL